jgi:hypothetical protein
MPAIGRARPLNSPAGVHYSSLAARYGDHPGSANGVRVRSGAYLAPSDEALTRIARALEAANRKPASLYEIRNVTAQERVASWTPRLFWVALVEAVATVCGVVLVGLTLRYTRRAATAAENTLLALKENSERELRAYLSVEPGGINRLKGQRKDCIGMVLVRNVGKIPAHRVHVEVHSDVAGGTAFSRRELIDRTEVTRAIQPGASMWNGCGDRRPLADICNVLHSTFVWGTVWYDDGYGKRRRTDFCHRYAGASHNPGTHDDAPAASAYSVIDAEKARYYETGNEAT